MVMADRSNGQNSVAFELILIMGDPTIGVVAGVRLMTAWTSLCRSVMLENKNKIEDKTGLLYHPFKYLLQIVTLLKRRKFILIIKHEYSKLYWYFLNSFVYLKKELVTSP